MHDERVRVKDCRQAAERVVRAYACLFELLEMVVDLALMPRPEDGLDIEEVLVEGRPPNACRLCYLRHRHRQQSLLVYERDRGVLNRLTDFVAVGGDRLSPKLRHPGSIQSVSDTYIMSRKLAD